MASTWLTLFNHSAKSNEQNQMSIGGPTQNSTILIGET